MKINKILVPVDFTEEAKNGYRVAARIARMHQATIELLHVVDIPANTRPEPMNTFGNESDEDSNNAEFQEIREVFATRLLKVTKADMNAFYSEVDTEGINVVERVEFDKEQRLLYEFIVGTDADLIVVGSKGAEHFEENKGNSNTARIVRHAIKPVLAVKADLADGVYNKIVFASNFEDVPTNITETVKSLPVLLDSSQQPELHLLRVISPGNFRNSKDAVADIDRYAQQHGIGGFTSHTYSHSSEEEGIIEFARDQKADLIVMATHGRTGLSKLFKNSITEEVVNYSPVDILAFHL